LIRWCAKKKHKIENQNQKSNDQKSRIKKSNIEPGSE